MVMHKTILLAVLSFVLLASCSDEKSRIPKQLIIKQINTQIHSKLSCSQHDK